ncbi:nitroreductase family protein [[Actinomadura] parvosata]|uniref:nitroreductase family protein n=1 Tax=[Actinomadura] parvosata TaxID=1955412 RepID=UPI00406C8BDD
MYTQAHQARRAEFGGRLYGAPGIGPDDHAARAAYDAESLRFYGAPHVAFLFVTGDGGPRLAPDVGAYMRTLLLAMTAYGVDSCPQGLLSFYAGTVRAELGITTGNCWSASPSATPTRARRSTRSPPGGPPLRRPRVSTAGTETTATKRAGSGLPRTAPAAAARRNGPAATRRPCFEPTDRTRPSG